MVFDFDGKMFLAALPGKSLRQRPRFQHAFHFQAEVVMQPARSMLLNDESRRAFDLFWSGLPAARWFFEVAFAFVFGQRHSTQINHGLRTDGHVGCRELAEGAERLFAKFGVDKRRYKNYASLGSGSPTRYRTKRRMTMFSPSSAILEFSKSLIVTSGFLMKPCSSRQTVL
jgi:hypothetical protein